MTAGEILKASERSALGKSQIVSHVKGKVTSNEDKRGAKSFGAIVFATMALATFAVIFGSGNLIPSAISERLIEETDVQYADAVESKKIIFQQAMRDGELPDNTVDLLKQNGVEVEKANNGELQLVIDNKVVTADNFIKEVGSDVNLYNAFNNATYSRAAYYYDDAARKVFDEIGTTRNNYSGDSEFDEVMEHLVGSGSKVDVDNVAIATTVEDGEEYDEYQDTGEAAKSSNGATEFINGVGNKNLAATTAEATLNSADTLKVADTIAKEQKSSLFFLTFMENISKMKAGEGNDSKINEAMNYLYEEQEIEVVDVETGEIKKIKGTALDSPSLYAVLAGSKVNSKEVNNYSSDRILKTIQNKLGLSNGSGAIGSTVASADKGIKGTIGRFLNIDSNSRAASLETLNTVNKTVDKSLVNNSYETIKGVDAGEFLVEGAVNVGKKLAKASGATAGDAAATASYARLNTTVLAMDAAVDRETRNPFDATSKNTFLGSIIYNLAISNTKSESPLLSGVKSFANTVGGSILSAVVPKTYADAADGYLAQFGECETYSTIGAVGSPQCSEVAVFDTSTLDDPLNDPGFVEFVNANTTLNASGSRTINDNSVLASFILYNDERITPLGVMDGGILESLGSGSSSVDFVSDVLGMIKTFLGASEGDKRIASGAAFVNSAANPDWQTYKYAQRYVSLARATESLRQYADDSTAYNNIKLFEGSQNPVVAFIDKYYMLAEK